MEVTGSACTKRPAPPELLRRSFCYGCALSTWDNQSKMCAKYRTLPTWNGTNYKKMTDLVKNENFFDFIVA